MHEYGEGKRGCRYHDLEVARVRTVDSKEEKRDIPTDRSINVTNKDGYMV